MEEGKKNIQFTTKHIRKYLDGELSGPEMQALEKAALEDPFLADAIEGYEESRIQSASFESAVTDLQVRLSERIRQKKQKKGLLIQMKWRVAASIIFVAGATLFTLLFVTRKTNQSEIASSIKKDSNVTKSPPLPGVAADTIGISSKNSEFNDTETKSTASVKPPDEKNFPQRKKLKVGGQQEIASAADLKKSQPSPNNVYQKDIDSVVRPDLTSSYNNEDKVKSPAAVIQTPQLLSGKVAGVTITNQNTSLPNFIAGIVVDEKDQPIPNASVSLSHANKGITTDSKGYFKLYLKNSDSVGRIAVNYIGYQPVSTKLKANDSVNNRIRLQPTTSSLNDVVVIGYGSADKSEYENPGSEKSSKSRGLFSSLPDSMVNKHATPIGGWTAYDLYLQTGKKITTADSVLNGTEIVTFEVNSKGELSTFKILESLSPAHDAEIIRLIKTGPEWKINKGKKQKCRVKLQYP